LLSVISTVIHTDAQLCGEVGVLELFPGITSHFICNYLTSGLKGVVLITYGSGNTPQLDAKVVAYVHNSPHILVQQCTVFAMSCV
jgi:L-asparaginase/Glu-tRNA(Gln) amidotransferase subunit D